MGRHTPEQKRRYNKTYLEKHGDAIRLRARMARQADHEAALARDAQQRAQNAEGIKASALKYDITHPGARKIHNLRYRLRYPERIKARRLLYNQQNPEAVQAGREKRRARLQNAAINDFTGKQWRHMKEAYGHRCVYCQRKMRRLTMDHIIPLSKGGNHTYSNIVPACKSCNSKKHAGDVLCPVQPLLLL